MLGDLGVPPVESVAGILSQAPVLPRTCARPRTLPAQRLNRPPAVLPKRRLALTGSCIPSPGGDPGLRQDPRTEDSRPRSDPDFKDKPRSWETVRGRRAGRGP